MKKCFRLLALLIFMSLILCGCYESVPVEDNVTESNLVSSFIDNIFLNDTSVNEYTSSENRFYLLEADLIKNSSANMESYILILVDKETRVEYFYNGSCLTGLTNEDGSPLLYSGEFE